jgi:hypothetical protein
VATEVTVNAVPAATEVGENDKLVRVGVAKTVNDTPLVATPLAVTTTLPVVAPVGTTATNNSPKGIQKSSSGKGLTQYRDIDRLNGFDSSPAHSDDRR